MKPILHLLILSFLLALIARPSSAEMLIERVTTERAKQLGMQIQANPAGHDALRIVLDFPTTGELKSFTRVDLEITDAGKLVLSSTLKDGHSKPGHVVVSLTAGRANLENMTLRVVSSQPALGGSGYDLRLKDFIDLKKPAAAAPQEEETRFLAAVQKAFDARDASPLDELTCWDRVPEKQKQNLQHAYAALVAEKDAIFDFKLVDADRNFVDRDRTEDGVTYRMNLPVTRQLNMKATDPRDKKTLFVLTFAVGEKDGKLFLLGSAPVK
jgi:hypothetical protein